MARVSIWPMWGLPLAVGGPSKKENSSPPSRFLMDFAKMSCFFQKWTVSTSRLTKSRSGETFSNMRPLLQKIRPVPVWDEVIAVPPKLAQSARSQRAKTRLRYNGRTRRGLLAHARSACRSGAIPSTSFRRARTIPGSLGKGRCGGSPLQGVSTIIIAGRRRL